MPIDSSDEVHLRFKILDNQQQPLPGVHVIIKQDSLLISQSDINGYLEINSLVNEQKPINIEISNLLGYENLNFEVIPNSDKELKVVLYPQPPRNYIRSVLSSKSYLSLRFHSI